MKQIELMGRSGPTGIFTQVDDEDYAFLSQWHWTVCRAPRTIYAKRTYYDFEEGHLVTVRMHRLLMEAQLGEEVDHRNGNGLDNRRGNLRLCSHEENIMNQRPKGGSSRFKGVSRCTGSDKWRCRIEGPFGTLWLGQYGTEELAAQAYNDKALELFGEFAKLNELEA